MAITKPSQPGPLRQARAGRKAAPDLPQLDFVGCEAIPMSREQYRRFEGRLEVWDAELRTAWMVREGPAPAHEGPSQRLAGLAERIAAVRGLPIVCYGAMALMVADAHGEPRRVMQADQTLYLDLFRANLIGARALLVGRHNFPDVTLEVDNTTDVRRGKLLLYEAWGFPELWVEVPDTRAPSRPAGRASGLTIHLLEDGAYQASPESRAFPGWRAEDIHSAFNEAVPSPRTHAILERLGRELGARGGTGPDDDPLIRSLRRESEQRGRERGFAEGRAQGVQQGRAVLLRQAALRFGAETAEALAGLLKVEGGPEHLAEIGERIIDCGTGGELLDCAERIVSTSLGRRPRRSPNGASAPLPIKQGGN